MKIIPMDINFVKILKQILFQRTEVLVQVQHIFTQLIRSSLICLDSTSSSMTLTKTHFRLSNDDEEYVDDFDNDDEDDWKPKKKKRRISTKKNKAKKQKNLVVVVSPSPSQINFPNCIIPLNKLR